MKDFFQNDVTKRFIAICDELIDKKIFKNKSDIARKIGMHIQNIYHILYGKRDITVDQLIKLTKEAGLNPEWLLTGEGEKFKKEEKSKIVSNARPYEHDFIEVPIVEVRARAGYIAGYSDPDYMETLPTIIVPREFEKGNYLAFTVDGDSMDDGTDRALKSGDIVLGKELPHCFWTSKLHYKSHLFVIVHEDGVLIKQIVNHDVENHTITCRSFNPVYEEFMLNLKDVRQLFYITKIVERRISI